MADITTNPSSVYSGGPFSLTYSYPQNLIFNAGQTTGSSDNYLLSSAGTTVSSEFVLSPPVSVNESFINLTTTGGSSPTGIACDSNNNIYVSFSSYTGTGFIAVYSSNGNFSATITISGASNLQALRIFNNYLYVCSAGPSCVYRIDTNTHTPPISAYISDVSGGVIFTGLAVNANYIAVSAAIGTSIYIYQTSNVANVYKTLTFSLKTQPGIDFDSYNNLYATTSSITVNTNNTLGVYIYNSVTNNWGPETTVFTNPSSYIYRITIDNFNNLYMTYDDSASTTTYLMKFPYLNKGSSSSVNYSLVNSYNYTETNGSIYQAIAINTLGQVYVADNSNNLIIKTIMPNVITFSNVVLNSTGSNTLLIQDTTTNDPDPIATFMLTVNPQIVNITTIPNPIIAGNAATIFYLNTSYLPTEGNQYYLKNQLGNMVSGIYIGVQGATEFTFLNVVLTAGLNILSIFNLTINSSGPAITIDASTVCFKEGTKILCYAKPEDKYIPIEKLTDNLYIKTFRHGYKKIKYILKSQLINSCERTMNKLYVMKKTRLNNLTEDLYITGSHAVLKDNLSVKEEEQMNKLLELFQDIDYYRYIDGAHKLLACFDERFQEFNEEGYYNIYHLVLESDNVFQNYGIYANGLMTESTDELTLHRMTDFEIINFGNKAQATPASRYKPTPNLRILSKIGKSNYFYSLEEINAIVQKKRFLEEQKEQKEQKDNNYSMVLTKTYKKYNNSKTNNTYKKINRI